MRYGSIRSTNNSSLGNEDSAFSGSNKSNNPKQEHKSSLSNDKQSFYGTRCRSTCNIIVSAVADFLPQQGEDNSETSDLVISEDQFSEKCKSHVSEEEPFVFNTAASYTVLQEKVINKTLK